ncbi:putative ABC transport system permease protein [Caldanaerobius fijiensis DSM 17918]|uniref:Putative ABC transport system permease protein n=1 Tax=Caldanaerobius fijiensis DSM 17918 TaxID=1121256 RepID=A0A1M5D8I8_9THEO|nr:ABC transporter permease [Caldanaerobius fijiensis]SHF62982.1 putative ABC transport system permease protein [Caldanaerobius fijiensis DSM 17918]
MRSTYEAFIMSIKNILSNKVRSFLTMLGLIIGVSSVIVLTSLAQGATANIVNNIKSMGTNLIVVNIMRGESSRNITYNDIQAFQKENSGIISGIAPVINGNVTIKYMDNYYDTSLLGTNEEYAGIQNINMASGRFISEEDVSTRRKVAVIGSYVARELFGMSNPVGQNIKINGNILNVVGVMQERQGSTQGSEDDRIIIPITTCQRLLQNAFIRTYYIEGSSEQTVNAAFNAIQEFLLNRFKSSDAFRIFNMQNMLDTLSNSTRTLTLLLGAIASISLIVGGIGIMNIMLVSVTERTREIGIRKAIGARRKDIVMQFLIESLVLSALGGLGGIILGILISVYLNQSGIMTAVISTSSIIVAFLFSLTVGIVFGSYPAVKASRLNPIDALRYE